MTLAKRLRELRAESGLTQSEFAEEIGLGRTTANYYEVGRTMPDLEISIRIANYFGVTVDYLCGLSNHRNAEDAENTKSLVNEFATMLYWLCDSQCSEFLTNMMMIIQRSKLDDTYEPIMEHLNNYLEGIFALAIDYGICSEQLQDYCSYFVENSIEGYLPNDMLMSGVKEITHYAFTLSKNHSQSLQILIDELQDMLEEECGVNDNDN